jgi:hypothetical protein
MDTIYLQNVGYKGNVAKEELNIDIKSFTYKFEFGSSYLLDTTSSRAGWALSWLIGGALVPQSGNIYLNDKLVSRNELRGISWLIRFDHIKRMGFITQSIRRQIRSGIEKPRYTHQLNEENIIKYFKLTQETYNRPITQLGSEAWRASCAIGFANGKRIFCFPDMGIFRPSLIKEYRTLWFEDVIKFLKSSGSLILYPAPLSKDIEGVFDHNIDFL